MINIINKIILSFVLIITLSLLTWCGTKNIVETQEIELTAIDNIIAQEELQQQIDILETQKTDLSFPSWLAKLDISAPKNMEIDKISSYKTTEEVEWFNSIHFVYNWEYNNAMKQAENIASAANISVSAEFKMAQDMIANINSGNKEMQQAMIELVWDLKWIVYTNYSLMWWEETDYMIAITVSEDGSLEIDVTDMVAMQKIADQYTK